MSKNLVIVESPAKAKTIEKYLGTEFEVKASYGHVRDLVPNEGAVDPENGFAMKYDIIDKNSKHVDAIARAAKRLGLAEADEEALLEPARKAANMLATALMSKSS